MKTLELFEQKTRDNGEKFLSIKDGEYHNELQSLIRDLHSNIFPIDEIYEIVKYCIDALIECDSLDDSYGVSDSFFPIYTGEINQIFAKIAPVLDALWNELSEFLYIDTEVSAPNDYMQACIYAFYSLCLDRCRDWLQSENFWKE